MNKDWVKELLELRPQFQEKFRRYLDVVIKNLRDYGTQWDLDVWQEREEEEEELLAELKDVFMFYKRDIYIFDSLFEMVELAFMRGEDYLKHFYDISEQGVWYYCLGAIFFDRGDSILLS